MIYTQNTELDNKNKQRSKWMKQYSLDEYGKDWEYVVGLSYRSKMIHNSKCRKCWLKLYEDLHKLDNSVYGFVTDELDDIGIGIHHHLIVGSKLDEKTFTKTISNNWDKRGVNWVERYVRSNSWDYIDYMNKHIGKTKRNIWDVFNNSL
tara:strand:+ start:50 stop:496 length:447 start_codon:yes stop_codon:yes gene_type:complete